MWPAAAKTSVRGMKCRSRRRWRLAGLKSPAANLLRLSTPLATRPSRRVMSGFIHPPENERAHRRDPGFSSATTTGGVRQLAGHQGLPLPAQPQDRQGLPAADRIGMGIPARAGTRTARYRGDDTDLACEYANVHDNSTQGVTSSTGSRTNARTAMPPPRRSAKFKPNNFGLYDTLGNVWEWTEDCLSTNYINAPTDGSPRVTDDCANASIAAAVERPGAAALGSAQRQPGRLSQPAALGFRVVRPYP